MCPGHLFTDDGHCDEFRISAEAYRGLSLLSYAFWSAQDAGGPNAEFAVGIDELREVGTNKSDLRWLIRKGYASHFVELHIPGQSSRFLHRTDSVDVTEASCFMLTENGALYARHVLADPVRPAEMPQLTPHDCVQTERVIPNYDCALRELTFDGQVIRRFRFEAPTQEPILTEFQQRNWPCRIDDPLPHVPGINPKTRLNKSVNRLNSGIHPPVIHFSCGGIGRGVYWVSKSRAMSVDISTQFLPSAALAPNPNS